MSAVLQSAMSDVVESAMQPIAKVPALLTGKIKIANDLVEAFANDSQETRRFDIVWDAVFNVQLTPSELEENLSRAQVIADEMDARSGWKAKEGAKGQEKYGPRRTSMNARASDIRQLFGALAFTNAAADKTSDGQKVDPKIKQHDGFIRAVKVARQCLKDQGIKWDGSPRASDEDKEAQREINRVNKVREDWIKKFPQRPGETIADYTTRMNSALDVLVEETRKAEEEKQVDDAATKLIKAHGLEFAAMIAEKVIELYNQYVEKMAAENTPTEESPAHEEVGESQAVAA